MPPEDRFSCGMILETMENLPVENRPEIPARKWRKHLLLHGHEAGFYQSIRLDNATPCAKTGICVKCKSDDTMCRIFSIIKRKPRLSDITVILVGEDLGF